MYIGEEVGVDDVFGFVVDNVLFVCFFCVCFFGCDEGRIDIGVVGVYGLGCEYIVIG